MENPEYPQLHLVDAESTIKMASNLQYHDRTKHIYVKYHDVWSGVERSLIRLEYINTKENIADIMMKTLPTVMYECLVRKLGIRLGHEKDRKVVEETKKKDNKSHD